MLVKLADPAAKVPNPANPGLLLSAEPFEADAISPFIAALLRDGTLVEAPAPDAAPVPATSAAKKG